MIILTGLLVLAASSAASAQSLESKTFQPSTKLVRSGPWRDFKFRLLVPEGSVGKSAIIEVDAKLGDYRVQGARYGFKVVVLYDPHGKRTGVMPGLFGRLKDFYVSSGSGMLGVHISPYASLQWVKSFVEIPGPALDLEAAERRFENEFDETKANQHLARGVFLDLTRATGPDLFDEPRSVVAELDVRAATDGKQLHLDMANPRTSKTASLWMDLREARIDRAIDTSGRAARNVATTRVWKTTTAKLMHSVATSTGGPNQPIEVTARSTNFRVLGTGEEFSVAALEDPLTKRITFTNYAQYFVSTSSGLIDVSIFGGSVAVRQPVVQSSDTGYNSATLDKFAVTFDPAAFRRATWDEMRISVANIIANGFFTRGSQLIFPRLEQIDISDGILHFVLVNQDTGQKAASWVDIRPGSLFLQRVVRVELEGQARPVYPTWIDGKARLVTPGQPARLEQLREVDARYGDLPFLGSGPKLAVVPDAQNKSISIGDGFNDFYRNGDTIRRNSDITFYVPRVDGLLAAIVSYTGIIEFSPAYFVATASAGGLDAAIASFEQSFDRDTFNRQIAGRKVAVSIAEAIGQDEFFDPVGKRRVGPRLDIIDLQQNVLRLALRNPVSQRTVTLWFDVNTLRLTRWSVDGGPQVAPPR